MTSHLLRPGLRTTLVVDGAACILMGLGLAGFDSMFGNLTALPPPFLRMAGLLLLPIGVFILAVASCRDVPGWGVTLVVVGNAAWVVASLLLLLTGLIEPNPLGSTLVLAQAAVVALLAGLEHAQRPRGERRILQA